MRRPLALWMALLGGLNVWRTVEAARLASALPGLAGRPALVDVAYGVVCAAAFAGAAGLVWTRHPIGRLWAVLATAGAMAVGFVLRLAFSANAEASATLGFYAILALFGCVVSLALSWHTRAKNE